MKRKGGIFMTNIVNLNDAKTKKEIDQSEQWATERMDELFKVKKFKEMGKENDFVFQSLVFLGNGSQQLSLATTVLKDDSNVSPELKSELKSLQQQLQDFQEKLRTI